MIEGFPAVVQALMGTAVTWGLTAAGAAVVFAVPPRMSELATRRLLDVSLGFSGGVMLAASFWSLLEPALEFAAESGTYGANGEWRWLPVTIGFIAGAAFVAATEHWLPEQPVGPVATPSNSRYSHADVEQQFDRAESAKRRAFEAARSWRRMLLMVIAITVHNFPEGLAVGVGFAAVGSQPTATVAAARTLAIGIGLQNFPEGLAVSLPLMRAGYSRRTAFWYGQLSGMVEPVAGLLGASLIVIAQPFLPYALAFAAGAMIYVVVDDLVPEAHADGAGNPLCSAGVVLGFVIMMIMDVAL